MQDTRCRMDTAYSLSLASCRRGLGRGNATADSQSTICRILYRSPLTYYFVATGLVPAFFHYRNAIFCVFATCVSNPHFKKLPSPFHPSACIIFDTQRQARTLALPQKSQNKNCCFLCISCSAGYKPRKARCLHHNHVCLFYYPNLTMLS